MSDASPEPHVVSSETLASGAIFTLRRDVVDLGEGGVVTREVVVHPGAVGVVALNENNEVLLIHQYRHPVGRRMWEIPAGLLDVAGEDTQRAAARELAEEGRISALRWTPLLVAHSSPGMSDERVEIFLAEGIAELEAEHDTFQPDGEELTIETRWTSLLDALRYVDEGDITNAMAVMGLLAAHRELARRREAIV